MGYSSSGGPDGLGVVNNTPSTTSDFNQLIALIAMMGNVQKGVEADRDGISGDQLYAGLLFTYTDKAQVELYDGSGWVVIYSDTGWISLAGSMTPNWSVQSPDAFSYRVVNGSLEFRGRLDATTTATNTLLTTPLPSSARPAQEFNRFVTVTSGGSNPGFVVSVTTGGQIIIYKGSSSLSDLPMNAVGPIRLG